MTGKNDDFNDWSKSQTGAGRPLLAQRLAPVRVVAALSLGYSLRMRDVFLWSRKISYKPKGALNTACKRGNSRPDKELLPVRESGFARRGLRGLNQIG